MSVHVDIIESSVERGLLNFPNKQMHIVQSYLELKALQCWTHCTKQDTRTTELASVNTEDNMQDGLIWELPFSLVNNIGNTDSLNNTLHVTIISSCAVIKVISYLLRTSQFPRPPQSVLTSAGATIICC